MFTGISDDDDRRKVVDALGGSVVSDWAECTHLVTDRIRRTVKFLCALSAGKHILDVKWLDACKKSGKFVDESKYTLKDSKTEKLYSFSFPTSLTRTRDPTRPKLFENTLVYATPSVKPPHHELREILESAGGQLLPSLPSSSEEGMKTLVVGHPDDVEEVRKAREAGWVVYSNEIVLTGILRQVVEEGKFLLED
ncbi:hypothetical protein HK104_007049, partial [Borealophlyctis nickersoniae]